MKNINQIIAFSSVPRAWNAFRAGAAVFGAALPSALPTLSDDTGLLDRCPEALVGLVMKTAMTVHAEDGEVVPAGINIKVTPVGVTFEFGSGRSAIELYVPSEGSEGTVSVGTHLDVAELVDAESAYDSAYKRYCAARDANEYAPATE